MDDHQVQQHAVFVCFTFMRHSLRSPSTNFQLVWAMTAGDRSDSLGCRRFFPRLRASCMYFWRSNRSSQWALETTRSYRCFNAHMLMAETRNLRADTFLLQVNTVCQNARFHLTHRFIWFQGVVSHGLISCCHYKWDKICCIIKLTNTKNLQQPFFKG